MNIIKDSTRYAVPASHETDGLSGEPYGGRECEDERGRGRRPRHHATRGRDAAVSEASLRAHQGSLDSSASDRLRSDEEGAG